MEIWLVGSAPAPRCPSGLLRLGPSPNLRPGFRFREPKRRILHLWRNPEGKRRQNVAVRPGFSVSLLERGQTLVTQLLSDPYEGRPQAPVNECNFARDEPKAEHIAGVGERAQSAKNLGTLLVAPPAAAHRFTGDGLGDVGNGSFRRGQDDSMASHEIDWVEAVDGRWSARAPARWDAAPTRSTSFRHGGSASTSEIRVRSLLAHCSARTMTIRDSVGLGA